MVYRRPINLLRPENELPTIEEPARHSRALYFFIAFIIFVGIIWGVRRFTLAYWPNDPVVYDAITLQPKRIGFLQTVKNFIFHSDNVLEGQAEDRVNILLLGIGGPGHDGPYLSDTNIILSLKPSTKEVAFISIPRDTGVKIRDHGIRKINSADAFGEAENPGQGGNYAREIFSETFGIKIPYYIRVDFKAFEEMIDAVGGVTINVPKGFTDSQFPGENAAHEENTSYQTITFTAGTQTLDGHRALQYVRSRHGSNGEDSDFARSRRQQLVLTALKEKLLSAGTYLNPVQVQNILSSLSHHVTTNLDFGQLMYLANIGRDINEPIKTLVLDNSINGFLVSSINESGAFILSPKTGNFDSINLAIAQVFDTTSTTTTVAPAITLPPATTSTPVFPALRVEVQNGTWRAGLASRVQKRLQDKGIRVIGIGNSLERPITSTVIYILNPQTDQAGLAAVKKLLAPASTSLTLPSWLQPNYDNPKTVENESGMKYNNETDVLILLGDDLKE